MILRFLIPDCRETSFLISRSLDGPVSWFHRLRLWIHLRICPPCADNQRQLAAMHRHAGSGLDRAFQRSAAAAGLPPRARERILAALQETRAGSVSAHDTR